MFEFLRRNKKYCGSNDVTFVTGLFDIGRKSWGKYTRPISHYLDSLQSLIDKELPMYVFCDARHSNRLKIRNPSQTRLEPIGLEDLSLFREISRIESAIERNKEAWPRRARKNNPEVVSGQYILVTNSKLDLVDRACKDDHFGTSRFCWIDAGIMGAKRIWTPILRPWTGQIIDTDPNKVLWTQRVPIPESASKHEIHEMLNNGIWGGMFIGGKKASMQAAVLVRELLEEYLDEGIIDDDEGTTIALSMRHPDLVHLQMVSKSWEDCLRSLLKS